MKKRALFPAAVSVFIFGTVSLVFAATTVRISASIEEVHQLNVALNKIVGSSWTPIADLLGQGIDFGELTKGSDNVYRSNAYFVIDAPVVSNKSGWTITHSATDFANGTANLNSNTNVKFVKVANADNQETPLASNSFISYQTAKSRPAIQASELTGARLRIYYSIAGGSEDASGVSVITTSKPTGTYEGTITLTLSP
ncbi:MAG: hypothetical protein PHE18_03310 [Candidatus Omnitrophica bacterium]|nr:hypothetical protein [Candidatus Omnitrophota bacterium]MDD5552884.1 hypothetical protein [Candidatus Omnitrophota bacterium]